MKTIIMLVLIPIIAANIILWRERKRQMRETKVIIRMLEDLRDNDG